MTPKAATIALIAGLLLAAPQASPAETAADTDEYVLTIEAPETVAPGKTATVSFAVVPKKGWKLNEDFPPSLVVSPPGDVSVNKPKQGKKDAVRYTPKGAKWSIEVKAATAGSKSVSGKLQFAVCTSKTCNPRKAPIAFTLKVK